MSTTVQDEKCREKSVLNEILNIGLIKFAVCLVKLLSLSFKMSTRTNIYIYIYKFVICRLTFAFDNMRCTLYRVCSVLHNKLYKHTLVYYFEVLSA